jgi:acyl-CoA reductase-like NAD-dependent aldehyde dehydrogenase
MEIQDKLYIGGEWTESSDGGKIEVLNPATNEPICEVARATAEDLRRAVEVAQQAFDEFWRGTTAFERGAILHKIGAAVEANVESLAQVETDDVGKPVLESANIDIPAAAGTFHYFGDVCSEIAGEVKASPYAQVLDYSLREPLGVVGGIIPWNFPFLLAARKVGSALAAGNTMVLKPASWAPLSTLLLGKVFEEAGLPAGVVNIVAASGPAVGEAFSQAPEVEEITFTGSTAVGRALYGMCNSGLKGCTLELGGKSPGLVLPDCDMNETVAGTLFGVYLNQGECCCALTRLIVHEDIYDEFVEKFVAGASAIKVGMPREDGVQMGPLVHPDHLKTVMGYVEAGKSEGATVMCGGNVIADGPLAAGNFMEPTVFADVTPSMRIWKEEIFGPVVTITKAGDIEEMVALGNDTEYGLAASVWTTNLKLAHSLVPQLEAGTVWLNLHNFVFPNAPYGGYKCSGLGSELGKEGVLALTRMKNVMVSMFPEGFKWY